MKLTKHIHSSLAIILLNIYPCGFSSAQTNKTDSLQQLLKSNAIHDTTRIKALNALAWQLMYSNPDTAILLCTQALNLLKKRSSRILSPPVGGSVWAGLLGQTYKNLGSFHFLKGSNDTALTFYDRAIEIYNSLPFGKGQAGAAAALGNCGAVYYRQGDYLTAIDYFQQALEIDKELGDKHRIAAWLGNMGLIFHNQGDYPTALDHYRQALEIHKELGNKRPIAAWLVNIGNVYHEQDDYSTALDHYLQALGIFKELGDNTRTAAVLGNIGVTYNEKGEYPTALDYFQQGLEIDKELGNKYGTAHHLTYIGNSYKWLAGQEKDSKIKDSLYATAIEHYKQALAINLEIGSKLGKALCLSNISLIYVKQHKPLSALPLADTAISLLTEMHKPSSKMHTELAQTLTAP